MSFLKAFGKAVARAGSRQITKHQVVTSGSRAYKKTGEKLRRAKSEGKWIDGRKEYRKQKRALVQKAYEAEKDRESFINDL